MKFFLLCAMTASRVLGFHAAAPPLTWRQPVRALQSSFVDMGEHHHLLLLHRSHPNELDYRQMLAKARECAFSDASSSSYSAKQARQFLNEIFHMESLCVSGILSGDVCDNVDEVAAVVANLREKAAQQAPTQQELQVGGQELTVTIGGVAFVVLPVVAALASLWDWAGRGVGVAAVSPFESQEWMWALRDGHFGVMLSPIFRNGGL